MPEPVTGVDAFVFLLHLTTMRSPTTEINIVPLFLMMILAIGCHSNSNQVKLFDLLPSSHTQVTFSNQLEVDGKFNIIEYLYYYDGGGVAVGDINNDGLKDLFFTSNCGPDKLYLNKGDLVFEDISKLAGINTTPGWSTGVAMADVNGDGHLDIYVCQLGDYKGITGKNQLYINNGDQTFTEKAEEYGLDHVGFSTQACFFDYDNDGDLDMYLLNHSVHRERNYGPASLRYEHDHRAGDKLFRNELSEIGRFTDVTEEADIFDSYIGYGLGVVAGDINKDGWLDIFVTNDFHENDYLYINNCDGTFTESLEMMMGHTSRASMGNDLADFNNDGWLDIVVLDMLPDDEQILKRSAGEDAPEVHRIKLDYGYCDQLSRNTLQLNLGNGFFSEIALLAGIHATDWSWAPLFADFDNDGYKDLFITNGIPKRPNDLDYLDFTLRLSSQGSASGQIRQIFTDTDSLNKILIARMPSDKIPNKIFKNNGDLTFSEKGLEWGMDQPVFSNGAAYVDLDNDGDLDVVINNINQEVFIYRNNSEALSDNHFIQIELKGLGKNRNGIGAKVIIKANDLFLYQEQMPVRGFQSSVDHVLHFGVGSNTFIDTLQVIWPDTKTQILTDIPSDQMVTLYQSEAVQTFTYSQAYQRHTIFEKIPDSSRLLFRHIENEFIDFDREFLLPHKLSTQGPKLAVGDVNGDGLDDLFIGGASLQPGHLFLQTRRGEFVKSIVPVFEEDRLFEDVESIFIDIDQDGDLDLYVVSGGSEVNLAGEYFRDRLYLNDGFGYFSKLDRNLPRNMLANGSCISAADIDRDGDVDLFVGSRSVVSKYGLDPPCYILENDGSGEFRDITMKIAPHLSGAGMVTDAIWTDFNNDGLIDLVIAGEWMPITLLRNNGTVFENVTTQAGLDQSTGWWNTIIAADFDRDGDIDFIAGNLGLNSKIKASAEKPATLYIKDFDNNGMLDQLICFYKNGFSTPFATRDELLKQLPGLKQKFPTYHDYSKVRTIHDIFSRDELSDILTKEAYEFRSCFIENKGDGTFELKPLPVEAQFSPIYGFFAEDFNGDGHLDVLLGGNFYGAAVNYGKYDASYGLLLAGDGKGGFKPVGSSETGFVVGGEIRDLQKIRTARGETLILVARNNNTLQIFNWKLAESGLLDKENQ